MITTPCWQEEKKAKTTIHYDSTPLPDATEVLIIGGGYTGLNAALTLARSGVQVVIAEKNQIASGASGRNAGMLLPGVKAPLADMAKKYGLDFAKALWQWTLSSIDYVENLIAKEEIQCDWHRSGSIELACKRSQYDEFADRLDFLDTHFQAPSFKVLTKQHLKEEFDSSFFEGGLLHTSSASLNPLKYVRALASLVQTENVSIFENTKVQGLKRLRSGEIEATIEKGTIRSQKVLIATNGYTPWRFPQMRRNMLSVGSSVIATEILPKQIRTAISPNNRMLFTNMKLLNYFRLTPEGRMLFGGRHKLSTKIDLNNNAKHLSKIMVSMFPSLKQSKITHSWSGNLAITLDFLPHLKEKNNIYHAYGYSGHGVSQASYMGWEAAQYMLNKKINHFHFQRKSHLSSFPYCEQMIFPVLSRYYQYIDRYGK